MYVNRGFRYKSPVTPGTYEDLVVLLTVTSGVSILCQCPTGLFFETRIRGVSLGCIILKEMFTKVDNSRYLFLSILLCLSVTVFVHIMTHRLYKEGKSKRSYQYWVSGSVLPLFYVINILSHRRRKYLVWVPTPTRRMVLITTLGINSF